MRIAQGNAMFTIARFENDSATLEPERNSSNRLQMSRNSNPAPAAKPTGSSFSGRKSSLGKRSLGLGGLASGRDGSVPCLDEFGVAKNQAHQWLRMVWRSAFSASSAPARPDDQPFNPVEYSDPSRRLRSNELTATGH
jgi:hypothetical protein